MYGCDEFCTYCIVPYTRGKERSRQPESIIKEVENLAKRGYVEVTLLGQNVNAYGKDFEGRTYTFANLLEDLNKTSIKRIRYTTSYPSKITQNLVDAHAKLSKLMPYIHLPIQSGSDTILKAMNRQYTAQSYEEIVAMFRKARPDIAVSSDFIVGFPAY